MQGVSFGDLCSLVAAQAVASLITRHDGPFVSTRIFD